MTKVYQTKIGEQGNCFAACLASILEVGIKEIPVMPKNNSRWLKVYQDYLKTYNLGINWVEPIGSNFKFYGYAIGAFEVKGKEHFHAVVCLNGRKKHNPFPPEKQSRGLGKLNHWFVITTLNPANIPVLYTQNKEYQKPFVLALQKAR